MRKEDTPGSEGDVLEGGGSGPRRPVRSAVLTVVIVATLAVWGLVRFDVSDSPGGASAESADAHPSPLETAGAPATGGSTANVFYTFAATGDAAAMSDLWADYVTVSIPGTTWTMTSREASRRETWWIRADAPGRSARDLLRPLKASDGAFSVYVEDVECVGRRTVRPVGAAGRVTSRVLVAIRPMVGTPCARWWAFDLVFTPEDRISEVVVHR